ncbi:hypothetical protein GCM10010218_13790 [Streptomyces mashuensis]|uniref:Uncharacterized protein n=1 Tax=Streptomyces mashuensis TaxID=33904 RepID=A0A919B183_9ACTN|nr:hypothetical protein GCM10010218_13790 [Streptomyces mashuensis]
MSRHIHTADDVAPGTITLCVQDGRRWAHTPVSAYLWEHAGEEMRAGLRDVARRPLRGASRPVVVVRREDVEGADACGANGGGARG